MTVHQLEGDCRVRLAELPAESVHCIPTSPPYFSLRDYGTEPLVWGGDAEHKHEWSDAVRAPWANKLPSAKSVTVRNNAYHESMGKTAGSVCECGAWLGSLGLEPTPELYIDHLLEVFRAVWRVLRKDGTVWLNIGDSYAGSGKGKTGWNGIGDQVERQGFHDAYHLTRDNQSRARWPSYAKPKDLLMIPARVALRLQADGWYVRSDIAWCKRSHMPESVEDRPTNAWEHIFLLTKSRNYFYDAEAVREMSEQDEHNQRYAREYDFDVAKPGNGQPGNVNHQGLHSRPGPGGRNMRNYWLLGPEPFSEAHFATFVTEVPRRAILAGTSEKGCCSVCGAPWRRISKRDKQPSAYDARKYDESDPLYRTKRNMGARYQAQLDANPIRTVGWRPTCAHAEAPVVPCTVLDPFSGAGTTLLVADRHGRDAIGCELSPTYAPMAINRIRKDAPLFAEVEADWTSKSVTLDAEQPA